jgi:(2R)-3-sulfolactate dehydrogenase (NADP+)
MTSAGPTVGQARRVTGALLAASGLEPLAAAQTAEALVLADVWGVHSHGLMRLPNYLQRLAEGGCSPSARLRPVTDTGSLVVYDGEDGLGHWQVWRAAETARQRCARSGVAVVAVGRSSHCGALGVYTLPLLEAGLVGLVFSHGPAVMPPWGGTAPVVSTSPLAAGIPCRPRPAIVDLAMTAVARGRIKEAAQRGELLPEGWAFTAAGEPTTDATSALTGMLAPLGGPKGFALAFLVEALTAGLVGPALSTEVSDMFAASQSAVPQRIAHLVLAVDPVRLNVDAPCETPAARLDQLAANVVAAGGRVPGSARAQRTEVHEQQTLALSASTWQEMVRWAERLDVELPPTGSEIRNHR